MLKIVIIFESDGSLPHFQEKKFLRVSKLGGDIPLLSLPPSITSALILKRFLSTGGGAQPRELLHSQWDRPTPALSSSSGLGMLVWQSKAVRPFSGAHDRFDILLIALNSGFTFWTGFGSGV